MTRFIEPSPGDEDRECPEDRLRDEHLRALGLMLSGFAHEFNTPLAVVASAIDTQRRCQEKIAAILQARDLTADDQAQLRDVLALMTRSMPALETGLERAQALARELRLAGRPDAEETPEPVQVVPSWRATCCCCSIRRGTGWPSCASTRPSRRCGAGGRSSGRSS